MLASSLKSSTDNASVQISRSLRKGYLDTRLDMVQYNNKRVKLDFTRRRTMLIKLTGLGDKTLGEERLYYNPSGYITYTLQISFPYLHQSLTTQLIITGLIYIRTNCSLGLRYSRTDDNLTHCCSLLYKPQYIYIHLTLDSILSSIAINNTSLPEYTYSLLRDVIPTYCLVLRLMTLLI